MPSDLVVLNSEGRAELKSIPDMEHANSFAAQFVVLGSYNTSSRAEQRRAIENDPVKRELFITGRLKLTD